MSKFVCSVVCCYTFEAKPAKSVNRFLAIEVSDNGSNCLSAI